jgi:hypothetical protein
MWKKFESWLYQPSRVALVAVAIAILGLTIDGSVFRLISLYRERDHLRLETREIDFKTEALRAQSAGANDPHHIERDARERFDLVEKNDLLFVFSENE